MDMHRNLLGRDQALEDMRALELLQAWRDIDPDYVRIANELVPDSGEYLPAGLLEDFVRADVPDGKVKAELKRQKAFVGRLANLLPSIFSFLKLADRRESVIAVGILDDCFHDLPFVSSSARRDRLFRESISALEKAETAVRAAANTIAPIEHTIWSDFSALFNAFLKQRHPSLDVADVSISEFRDQLAALGNIIQVCVVRAKSEDDYLVLHGNQVKSHVVEAAYTMCDYYSGPPLVTTPGSDFSTLCGLIYELVSGKADEGLAGAINKFAKSRERLAIDGYRAEADRNNAVGDEDNFFFVREGALSAVREAHMYSHVLTNAGCLTDDARDLVIAAINAAVKRGEEALRKNGPHIVWAHRAPQLAGDLTVLDERRAKLKQVTIELGVERRRRQST
jgi:hypothetical protein